MTAQRISHQERKARRINVYTNAINFILQAGNTVKVNDLYELLGNGVFSSEQYFVRCFIDAARKDGRIHLHTAKKRGTYAAIKGMDIVIPEKKSKAHMGGVKGRKPAPRKVEMGGAFGIAKYTMTGQPVNIEIDEDVWKLCKKTPKTFSHDDTVEVYKLDEAGRPNEYLQVTDKGRQFHYTVDA